MLVTDLKYFAENFGWLVAVALVLILNGDKVAARLGTFIPPLANWLERRRVEKEVVESAKLAASLEQDDAVLHHEMDSDAAEQAHALRQDDRMLGIVERTLDNFWQEQQRQTERWTVMLQAIADNKTALMSMKSTLSLHSQVIAQQVDAFAALECVKAARRAARIRKTNGD